VFCDLIRKGKEEREFTAEAQRGKRGKSRKGLNTKARRHKGQKEREETFSRKERRGHKE